jgi:hypothetical protein
MNNYKKDSILQDNMPVDGILFHLILMLSEKK